ncbi:MAG: DUF126 domain-containing protein [Pseudomonadota bacterium]
MVARVVAKVLNPGAVTGVVQVLHERLSFWGGFDPREGRIIDRHHPQYGCQLKDKLLVLPGSRGSAGTPAGVAEAVRLNQAPKAIILGQVDVNVTVGMIVASHLYDIQVPVLVVEDQVSYNQFRDGETWTVLENGLVEKRGSHEQ